jgi:serine/threonine protein kinase
VKTFGHGRCDDGTSFFVMEYVDGRDLAEIMEHAPGFVTPTQILAVGIACAAALVACHEGVDDDTELCVTHSNLVPANVMITRAGDIKLIDFGEATWVARGEPSKIDPAEASNARADVRALGLILYQLTTGKSSLRAMELATVSPSSIPRWVPYRLRRIIARIVDTGAEPWYRNMRHVYEDLKEVALVTPGSDDQSNLLSLVDAVRSPPPPDSWLSESQLELEDAEEDPSLPFMSSTEVRQALRRSDAEALLNWIEDFRLNSESG